MTDPENPDVTSRWTAGDATPQPSVGDGADRPADAPPLPAGADGPQQPPAAERADAPRPPAYASHQPPPVTPPVTHRADTAAETPAEPAATHRRHRRRSTSFWRELPFLVLIALVLALLIKTFLVQAFFIPSGSMENTLKIGDRVLVNKLVYRFRDPHRGEIIVFRGPESWQESPEFTAPEPSNPVSRVLRDIGSALGVSAPSSKDFIKRVIGVAGDHVVCCDPKGRITVNGHPLDEPYLYPGAKPSNTPFDVTVPSGRLWVMGDHRDESADSRAHMQDGEDGTIPVGNVIGRAFVRVWPPGDWGTLGVPDTFHQTGLAAALGNPLALGFVGAVPLTLARRRLRSRSWRRSTGRSQRRSAR